MSYSPAMNGSNTRRVTLLNNPYTNPANGLPWTVGQDVRGFQYQIALDALPPGITLDMIEQSQDWFVDNDTTCYRLKLYAGASGDPITISGNTGIVVSGTTTVSGETGYYISVYDTTTQVVADATTAYPMTINTFVEGNGITLGASGQLYIENTAVYNIQFSSQFANTDSQDSDVNVWLRMAPSGTVLSGTSTSYDIEYSNGLVSVPSKHGTTNGHTIIGWSYVMTISGGQYVQLWWQPESITVSMPTLPAGTTPTVPISPSVTVTIQQVTSMVSGSTTISGVAAGGDLTGYYPDPSLVSITTGGYYGSSTQIPVIGVDAKGRVFSATTAPTSDTIANGGIGKMFVAGHSYTDQFASPGVEVVAGASTTSGNFYNLEQSLIQRTYALFGVQESQVKYIGVGGANLIADTLNGVKFTSGTASGTVWGGGQCGWNTVLQSINPRRTVGPYTSDVGVALGIWGINDTSVTGSGVINTTSQYVAAYGEALRTVTSRFRTSSLYENSDPSVVASGFTISANTINSGDDFCRLTTSGDSVTITLPSDFVDSTVTLGFIGAFGSNGGSTVISKSGSGDTGYTQLGSINTTNILPYGQLNRVGQVYRCVNLPSGTQTIRVQVSGLDTGTSPVFEGYTGGTRSATLISGSITVPLLSPGIGGLGVGATVSGVGIQSGTTIASITRMVALNQITLSKAATQTFAFPSTTTLTIGPSTTVTVTSGLTNLTLYQSVSGTNFAANSYITAETLSTTSSGVNYDPNTITLNTAPTATTNFTNGSIVPSVDFDYWQIETPYPNPVLIPQIAKLSDGSSGYFSGESDVIGIYNQVISGTLAEFDGPVGIAQWQDSLRGYPQRTYSHGLDIGVHPSTLGAMYLSTSLWESYLQTTADTNYFSTPTYVNAKSSLPVYPVAPIAPAAGIYTVNLMQTGLQEDNTTRPIVEDSVAYTVPIVISEPCYLSKAGLVNMTTGTGAGTIYFALYWDYKGVPYTLYSKLGSVSTAGTGAKTVTFANTIKITTPGVYWLSMVANNVSTNTHTTTLVGSDPKIKSLALGSAKYPTCYISTVSGGAFPSTYTLSDTNDWAPQIYLQVYSA